MAQDPALLLPAGYLAWLRELARIAALRARRPSGDGQPHRRPPPAPAPRDAIRTGSSVSLARPLAAGPSQRHDGLPAFALEVFRADGPIGAGTDHLELDCHGRLNTHIDGLNHMGIDGTWYGGWSMEDATAPSIIEFAGAGLVTRAVYADVAGARGTPWVDVGPAGDAARTSTAPSRRRA